MLDFANLPSSKVTRVYSNPRNPHHPYKSELWRYLRQQEIIYRVPRLGYAYLCSISPDVLMRFSALKGLGLALSTDQSLAVL